jgi:hypothetical protein
MNNIVSIGIFLFGLGYCIQSIATAMALPQGPSVSMGNNPVDSFYGSNGNTTLSLNSNYDFILTTGLSNNTNCQVQVNGNAVNSTSDYNIFHFRYNYNVNSAFTQGQGSLNIPAGSTVTLSNCSQYLFSGYYVQP